MANNIISEIEKNIGVLLRTEYRTKDFDKNEFMLLFNKVYNYINNLDVAKEIVHQAKHSSRYEYIYVALYNQLNLDEDNDESILNFSNTFINQIVDILSNNFEKYYKNTFTVV